MGLQWQTASGSEAWRATGRGRGSIHDITYKDIQSNSNGSNQIRISGYDEDHLIHDITLENIRLGTVQLSDYDTEHFYVNEFAKSIRLISQSNPAGKLLDGPYYPLSEVHNAAEEFSVQQGENGWHYRTWQAGVGTYDMSWNPDGSGHWARPEDLDAVWKSGDSLYMHPMKHKSCWNGWLREMEVWTLRALCGNLQQRVVTALQ